MATMFEFLVRIRTSLGISPLKDPDYRTKSRLNPSDSALAPRMQSIRIFKTRPSKLATTDTLSSTDQG
jgi:hypothetical protein